MIASTEKATHIQTKAHNKRLILKTIYDQGRISRAEIARMTRLTRTTVSNLVAEFIDEGLVEEIGLEPSRGGKPATLLGVVDDSRHLIGIDLANSEFRGAVVNLRGEVKHRLSLPVNDTNGEAALTLAYQLIDELIQMADSPLLGIGIGTPGLINAAHSYHEIGKEVEEQRDLHNHQNNMPVGQILERQHHYEYHVRGTVQMKRKNQVVEVQTPAVYGL